MKMKEGSVFLTSRSKFAESCNTEQKQSEKEKINKFPENLIKKNRSVLHVLQKNVINLGQRVFELETETQELALSTPLRCTLHSLLVHRDTKVQGYTILTLARNLNSHKHLHLSNSICTHYAAHSKVSFRVLRYRDKLLPQKNTSFHATHPSLTNNIHTPQLRPCKPYITFSKNGFNFMAKMACISASR